MTTNLPPFVPNNLIVRRNETASESDIAQLRAVMGVTQVTTSQLSGLELWKFSSANVPEMISAFGNDPRVQYMEPNYTITLPNVQTTSPTQENLATTTPQTTPFNDPGYPLLWGLNNTGQTGGKADADIDYPEALNMMPPADSKVIVAVIDSGVDTTHRDLAENIWVNEKEMTGITGQDDDGNGYTDDVNGFHFFNNTADLTVVNGNGNVTDDNGHGTHVAGTIAAVSNNGEGLVGVASKNSQIMAVKFIGANGSGNTFDAIQGIIYAVKNGAKILNNSWGGLLPIKSEALEDAIENVGKQGVLFIAAAGNSSLYTDILPAYPASYSDSSIISVAATDHKDLLAYYSNSGKQTVDLAAPGTDIYSTLPGNQYGYLSGTSMASPHVAGAAAVVWAKNPTWTAQEVKKKVMDSTDPYFYSLDFLISKAGRLNLFKALGGSTSNNNSNLGPIPLRIASSLSPAGAGNLTETANAETDKDALTGGPAADTLRLPFAQSSVSAKDLLTDFGSEIIDLVSQGRAAIEARSLSTVPTLEKGAIPAFIEANGASAANQALENNSDLFAVAKTSPFADDRYLVGLYDATKPLGF